MSEKKIPVRVASWPEVTSSNCLSSLFESSNMFPCFLFIYFFNSGWFDQRDRLVMLCEASKHCCHGYPQFNAPCKTLVPWYEFVFFCSCSLTDRFLSVFFLTHLSGFNDEFEPLSVSMQLWSWTLVFSCVLQSVQQSFVVMMQFGAAECQR